MATPKNYKIQILIDSKNGSFDVTPDSVEEFAELMLLTAEWYYGEGNVTVHTILDPVEEELEEAVDG